MTAITPIPTTRISSTNVSDRLTVQLQQDQRALADLQVQVGTGQRIAVPSQDAPAALRAIGLQRLLERKDQAQINLNTSSSFLTASDVALSVVSGTLADVHAAALGVVGTVVTDQQREAIAELTDDAIAQLLDNANQSFRGRYLFAGSDTGQRPYEAVGDYVLYVGNESRVQSYADTDLLFDTNRHGNEVFGAISNPVRSGIDLNPHLNENTLLSTLRGGAGVDLTAPIVVADGTSTSAVDLSYAATVGDVARLIEANPPAGRTVRVEIGSNGLIVSLDATGGGNLTITESAGGTTAQQLGILSAQGVLTGPLNGTDVDPAVLPTTELADILGTKAEAALQIAGANNDLIVQASQNGDAFNDVAIQFVDDNLLQAALGVTTGNEFAEFDTTARAARASLRLAGNGNDLIITATTPGTDFNNVRIEFVNAGDVKNSPTATYVDTGTTRTLTLGIDDNNETTVADLISAIDGTGLFTASFDPSAGESFNPAAAVLTADAGVRTGDTGNSGGNAGTLYVHINEGESTAAHVATAISSEGTFTAQLDPRDAVAPPQIGAGIVDVDATATTSGGSGIFLDQAAGLQITNGGQTHVIDLSEAVTVEDLLNTLNGSPAGVLAEINITKNGLNLRSRFSGSDFSIGENGGQTAAQLGLRTFTGDTRLDELNRGVGVETITGTDFTIVSNDGTVIDVDASSVTTIGDLIDLINSHPLNHTGTTSVTAQLAEYGNGIELIDDNPNGTDTLIVRNEGLSRAAEFLGLIEVGESESVLSSAATTPTADIDLVNPNSDIVITAAQAGTQFGGTTVIIDNAGGVVGNSATVTYDSVAQALTIDVDPAATTAQTVVDAINLEGTFTSFLSATAGPNDGSGLVVDTGTVATLSDGSPERLTGRDVAPLETDSIFNTLIRLKNALQSGDEAELERAIGLFDPDIERVNFARADIGSSHKSLDVINARIDEERIELKRALSEEIDTDLTEAIAELTNRQIALQASLRVAASLMQVTLFDFI